MPPWLRKLPWELLPVALVMLGPLLRALVVAAKKKREERETLLRRERAEIEALRTGRKTSKEPSAFETLQTQAQSRSRPPIPAPSTKAAPRPPRQPAAKQRAPKRQGSPSVRLPTTPPTARGRTLRLPGGVVIEIPPDPVTPPARPEPTLPTQREPQPSKAAHIDPIRATDVSQGAPAVRRKAPLGISLPKTRHHWKQAMVMREILSPPLSLREGRDR